MACSGGTEVEHSRQNPVIEGSNPASGTIKESLIPFLNNKSKELY